MSKVNKNVTEKNRRGFARQHVLLKAMLDTGDYEFECVAYDLSLSGVRVKLDLPLKTECEVWLMVKGSPHIPAKVAWTKEGYVGLKFSLPSGQVAEMLGNVGDRLPKI